MMSEVVCGSFREVPAAYSKGFLGDRHWFFFLFVSQGLGKTHGRVDAGHVARKKQITSSAHRAMIDSKLIQTQQVTNKGHLFQALSADIYLCIQGVITNVAWPEPCVCLRIHINTYLSISFLPPQLHYHSCVQDCHRPIEYRLYAIPFERIRHGRKQRRKRKRKKQQRMRKRQMLMDGFVVGWLGGWVVEWSGGWVVRWLDGWMVGWLDGCVVGWLISWIVWWFLLLQLLFWFGKQHVEVEKHVSFPS